MTPYVAGAAFVARLLVPFALVPSAPSWRPPAFLDLPPESEPPVYPSVHTVFVSFSETFEGLTSFMYLDQLGLVTVGVGNLIDESEYPAGTSNPAGPALKLSWQHKGGAPASPAEVLTEWERVKALQAMKGAGGSAFGKGALLFVTAESEAQLIEDQLVDNEAVLRSFLPNYDEIPADGELAIHDMAWAMGPLFLHGYPRFRAAVLAGDFATAADECAITHPVNSSIEARNHANRTLLRNAAQVLARGYPRANVFYPRDLAAEVPATVPSPPPPVDGQGDA